MSKRLPRAPAPSPETIPAQVAMAPSDEATQADEQALRESAADLSDESALDPPPRVVRAAPAADPDLVRRAREGEVHAFEALYRQWHRRIYHYILQMVNNETEAIDLTQDLFVRLWEVLPTLRAEEAFTSYLYRMAINLCRDQYRRRGRAHLESLDQPRNEDGDDERGRELADPRADPTQPLTHAELSEQVQAALAKLSPDHRTVIVLHHFQDLELVEIARIMGCAEGTVKSRLARAREELKRKLQGYLRWE